MKKISLLLGVVVFIVYVSARCENSNSNVPLIKVGTINFAVLDTAVSNEKPLHTTVQATIAEGKYKGAKLTGELMDTQESPNVVLKQHRLIFSKMHLNGELKPIKIFAYAIDPDTARSASSNKVDSKYLSNNGSTLAVSFVQSYSKPWYQKSNDNPTKVKINSGTNIGILFMSLS